MGELENWIRSLILATSELLLLLLLLLLVVVVVFTKDKELSPEVSERVGKSVEGEALE